MSRRNQTFSPILRVQILVPEKSPFRKRWQWHPSSRYDIRPCQAWRRINKFHRKEQWQMKRLRGQISVSVRPYYATQEPNARNEGLCSTCQNAWRLFEEYEIRRFKAPSLKIAKEADTAPATKYAGEAHGETRHAGCLLSRKLCVKNGKPFWDLTHIYNERRVWL